MATAEELISELRSGGTVDSEGQFTLDRALARSKLRSFQLSEPLSYVLLLVQAAVLKGARKIDFDIGALELRLSFDGEPFSAKDLQDLFDALFGGSHDDSSLAQLHLAMAATAALGSRAQLLQVRSGKGSSGTLLEMRPNAPDKVVALDGQFSGTQVRVRRPFSSLRRILDAWRGNLLEAILLRHFVHYAEAEVTLDGKKISAGHTLDFAQGGLPFAVDGIRGVLGLNPQQGVPSTELRIVQHGVTIGTTYPDELLPRFVIVAESAAVHRDISLSRVVEDDSYQKLLDGVFKAQLNWLGLRIKSNQKQYQGLEQIIEELLNRMPSAAPLGAWLDGRYDAPELPARYFGVPAAQALLDVPLFRDIRTAPVTLGDLVRDFRQHGSLAYSELPGKLESLNRPLVLHLPDRTQVQLLSRLFEFPLIDQTAALHRESERLARIERWRQRPAQKKLLGDGYDVREPLAGPGVVGEIAVRLGAGPGMRLRIVKEGCLLLEVEILPQLLDIEAVLDADFTPGYLLDSLVADSCLKSALDALLDGMVRLCAALAAKEPAEERETWRQRRASVLRRLLAAASPRTVEQLLSGGAGLPVDSDERLSNERGEPERVRASLQPLAIAAALEELPLFEGLDSGSHYSLAQLRACTAAGGIVVGVVSNPAQDPRELRNSLCQTLLPLRSQKRFREEVHGLAPAGLAMPAAATELPLCLWLASEEGELLELLRNLLPDTKVHDGQPWFAMLKLVLKFLGKPVVPNRPELHFAEVVPIEGPDIHGSLGFDPQRPGADTVLVTLLVRQRPICRSSFFCPGGGYLLAQVQSGRLRPTDTMDNVEDGEALDAVFDAVLGAVPSLCDSLNKEPYLQRSSVQRFFLSLICAIFPLPVFRRIYARLRQSSPQTADRQYLAILQLRERLPLSDLAEVLDKLPHNPDSLNFAAIVNQLPPRLASTVEEDTDLLFSEPRWLSVLFPDKDSPFHIRCLRPLKALTQIPLFFTMTASLATLAELRAIIQAGQPLQLGKGHRRSLHSSLVLRSNHAETRTALSCLFDPEQLWDLDAQGEYGASQASAGNGAALNFELDRSDGGSGDARFINPVLADLRRLRDRLSSAEELDFSDILSDAPQPTSSQTSPPVLEDEEKDAPVLEELAVLAEKPAPVSSAEALRRALVDDLERLGIRDDHLLRQVDTASLRVEGCNSDLAVIWDSQVIRINLHHPLAAAALTNPLDPIWRWFVLSAVYTAVNRRLLEVTDEDEARFLALLAKHLPS